METDLRRIPDFVWRELPVATLGVPLLMFHWLHPDSLERYLLWLRAAGYHSLRSAEVAGIARGERPAPARGVLLTFDDGVYNNWSVVAPLFRRHGFSGVAFVIPRLLREGAMRATIDDAAAGRVPLGAVLDDRTAGRYLTWPEVSALDREGVLEIESHSHDHAQVFVSDELLDFQHPGPDGWPRYPWLWSAWDAEPDAPLWGAPVYRTAPRMAGRRYQPDPRLRDACQNFVAIRGERGYFADVTWREELTRFARLERRRFGPGRLESPGETASARLLTLRRAREVLRDRLGREVRQVALPWSRGARDAPELIRAAGYEVGYTREAPSERLRAGASPFDLARVEGYWLESLPGPGRVSIARRAGRALARHLPLRSR